MLLAAIVLQTTAVNIANVYTAGLSLVNTAPRLGRFRATVALGAAALLLSGFPALVNEAQRWITHLGNVGAPLAGVVLADYVVLQRMRIDVPALFRPLGRYRYLHGVNPAALGALAIGIAVYYAVPDSWLKAAWGVGIGAASHLGLSALQTALAPRLNAGEGHEVRAHAGFPRRRPLTSARSRLYTEPRLRGAARHPPTEGPVGQSKGVGDG